MRRSRFPSLWMVLALGLAVASGMASCRRGGGPGSTPRPAPGLAGLIAEDGRERVAAFSSEAELEAFFARMASAEAHEGEGAAGDYQDEDGLPPPSADGAASTTVASESAPPARSSVPEPTEAEASDSASDDESITNVQEAGVDEGGIVKSHGDHLVVLRRGRLFSIGLAGDGVRPISAVDAYPRGAPPGDWYDEMLIHGDRVVVVGYNYQVGATELGFFDIDSQGVIRHRKTYYLRSYDYYSSSNYASRLIGDRLIFYMPLPAFEVQWQDGRQQYRPRYPAIAEWRQGQHDPTWHSILGATAVYQPVQPGPAPLLHTVVTCELSRPTLSCSAQGILGPEGRTFYVSAEAVYVWTVSWDAQADGQGRELPPAAVYRLPLRGGAPGALRVWGVPTDQLSFKEGDDGYLNVLVRSEGMGDWMGGPRTSDGAVALLRVPLPAFDIGVATVTPAAYSALPEPGGYEMRNRFVGDHVLYGAIDLYAGDQGLAGRVLVYPYRRPGARAAVVPLPHGVERIEAMGSAAVVVGSDGRSLHFSAIALGDEPRVAGRYEQQGAAQGEERTHGFFFRSDGADDGMLGLPVRGEGGHGSDSLMEGSAAVLYLSVRNLGFAPLGSLVSRDEGTDDDCVASCADWYGNARPIFYRGRVFALLGYELVEGRIEGGRILEVRRANFHRESRPTALEPRR